MTGGTAAFTSKIGDGFAAWDGYIEERNIALKPFIKIVQSWRTSEFNDNEKDSQIEILRNATDGETELTLVHSEVPESGEHYKKGWDDHYYCAT